MTSLVKRAICFVSALLLVVTVAACGESQPTGPYEAWCQMLKRCQLDGEFDAQFDSVSECIEVNKTEAEASRSGACLEAYEANIECRAYEFECTSERVSYDGGCEEELTAQEDACAGQNNDSDIIGREGFAALCNAHLDCLGESAFQSEYGDFEACISELHQSVERYDGECKQLASDFYKCGIENYRCNKGTPISSDTCGQILDEFQSKCD